MKKVIITTALVVLTFFGITYSQELSRLTVVGEASLVEDGIVASEHRDANGRICAGIMIVSDMEGFIYQSNNGIVDVNNAPGQDLVFVSPDERVLEVYHSGYEPLKIILSEYGVKLEPQRIWKFKITGDKKLTEIPINIITEPEGANIYIDNKPHGSGQSFKVSAGKHTLRIEKEGYRTITKEITVSESSTLFRYTLQEIQQEKVTIKSIPTEALILVDDIDVGKTNKQVYRFPGRYKLKLVKSKYETIDTVIIVKENGTNEFDFSLFKTTAILTITTKPFDARVLLDGEKISSYTIELSPGKHKIDVSKTGYFSENRTITIEKGKDISQPFRLKQKVGKLQIVVEPMETQSILKQDGKEIDRWTGSNFINNLPVGRYTVACTYSGFQKKEIAISIELDKTSELDIRLEEAPEILGGAIDFKVTPYWAKIYVDGKKISETIARDLEKGTHVVKVTAGAGYETIQRTIKVKDRDTTNVTIVLEKKVTIKPKKKSVAKKSSGPGIIVKAYKSTKNFMDGGSLFVGYEKKGIPNQVFQDFLYDSLGSVMVEMNETDGGGVLGLQGISWPFLFNLELFIQPYNISYTDSVSSNKIKVKHWGGNFSISCALMPIVKYITPTVGIGYQVSNFYLDSLGDENNATNTSGYWTAGCMINILLLSGEKKSANRMFIGIEYKESFEPVAKRWNQLYLYVGLAFE